ncbi:MAG: hypothetical protein ABSH24_20675 [Bryobacteraceae bacterium]|jgi:hypothetical protein
MRNILRMHPKAARNALPLHHRTVYHRATRNPLRIGPGAEAGPKKPVWLMEATRNILRMLPKAARKNALTLPPFPVKTPAP